MVTEEVEDGNRRSRKEWGSPAKTVKKKKKRKEFFSCLQPWEPLLFWKQREGTKNIYGGREQGSGTKKSRGYTFQNRVNGLTVSNAAKDD